MSYDAEQKKVIRKIKRIGRKRDVGRKRIKSALMTGKVESNFRQLDYGDADSTGWRQERASLYGKRSLKRSINGYYDEAAQHDHGQSAGELAADVQRPAAQYRGRYAEQSEEAKRLLGTKTGRPRKRVRTGTRTRTVPDTDARRTALLGYLDDRDDPDALLALATGLRGATKTKTVTTRGRDKPKRVKASPAKSKPGTIAEMYHDPGISMDSGQKVAPIGGHGGHVHFASEDPQVIKRAARLAQKMGLHVGENPKWDPVDPVHTSGSYHYQRFKKRPKLGKAIDVSGGTPAQLLKYNRKLARRYG